MILAMAAVVTVVAAAVVCRYELAAAGSSSWKLEPAGGSGSARYWEQLSWRAAQLKQLCGVVTSYFCSLYLHSCGSKQLWRGYFLQ